MTNDLTAKIKAGELVNLMAQQVGGKGGGRPDMAMAGGSQPENVAQAIKVAQDWLNKKSVVQAGWWNANRSLIDRISNKCKLRR